ncbi:MAG: phosphatidate cytidylyltransferase [Bacteroidales bacterium]
MQNNLLAIKTLSNLIIRSLSGVVFVILVIGSILLHPLVFAFVFWIISLLGLHEFYAIIARDEKRKFGLLPYISGSYLYLSLTFLAHHMLVPYNTILVLLNIPLVGILLIIELYSGHEKPFNRISTSVMGILYVMLPLALLNFFYYPSFMGMTSDPILLIAMFSLIWINDTFAYLSGLVLGKHLLFPRISPKKTWEGSAGGAIFTMITAVILALNFTVLSTMEWIIFAGVIVVFATLGDLVESMLKRSYQLKDSGNIIPGHGGVLDRFDATLGVAPVAFVLLLIIWLQ